MTTYFEIYYIALSESNGSPTIMSNVARTLRHVEGCHRFWGDGYCLVASPFKPDIPNTHPLDNTFIRDNKDYFLDAAADANIDKPGVYIEYERLAEQNGLDGALRDRCASCERVRRDFLEMIRNCLVGTKQKLVALCEVSELALELYTLKDGLHDTMVRAEHLCDKYPGVLRQLVCPYQSAIAAQMGQLDGIIHSLGKAKQIQDVYHWLPIIDGLCYLQDAFQEQIDTLGNLLHIDKEPSETSTVADDESFLQEDPNSLENMNSTIRKPRPYHIFLICAIILYTEVENLGINSRPQNLEEILSWEEGDWIKDVEGYNSLDASSVSSHCQNLLLFKYCDFSATDIGEEYANLIAGVENVSKNRATTSRESRDFNAVQKLIILCAGLGLYTAAPRVIERVRPQISVPDITWLIQPSPLYKKAEKEVIQYDLEITLNILEPPMETGFRESNCWIEGDDTISHGKKRSGASQDSIRLKSRRL
ncbi:hypothetical protein TEQG_08345 [Trichophyton equinum CBS 127.97]|uniref:Uncharacterized protein n=1 Tax=Trichophyton equinum (strain ATCC MYA-4606 / CBS 127.97) TaxID=559882 RepID=F2Q5M6_TRIEC|nr:hypothetical protein TEQG_08345 [Trichophyton equinum CBS 127.97]